MDASLNIQYPVNLSFRILTLASKISVTDASGREILFVQQKMFKLKEKIHVFSDESKSRELFTIQADRILDFSARYGFTDVAGVAGVPGDQMGAVRRQGMRSLWRARYDIEGPDGAVRLHIEEENPWVKALDGMLGQIPLVGMFTGYLLNPRYRVVDEGTGQHLLTVVKHRSFLESRFEVRPADGGSLTDISLSGETGLRSLLSILVMVLLERNRG